MSNYVKVNVVCPCGRLLDSSNRNSECQSITKGVKKCPSCGKKVAFQIQGGKAYTSYQK